MIDFKDVILNERLKDAERQTKPKPKKPKQKQTAKPEERQDPVFLITILIALFCIITQTLLTIYLL